MPIRLILLVGAGIAILVALAVAALSYMRAVNAVSDVIREKKPSGWEIGMLDGSGYHGNPRPLLFFGWISGVVFGLRELDLPDDGYRVLLRAARWRLLMCLALFTIFLISLGWVTRGSDLGL
jgi:hypothetical protein